MCFLGSSGESRFHPQLSNDNRTFLYHLCTNPEGLDMKLCVDADCAQCYFEVPNETTSLTYEDVSELCFQYSQLKLVTLLQSLTL